MIEFLQNYGGFVRIGILVLVVLIVWFLFFRRVYKEENGIVFVRHGQLGTWMSLEEHIKIYHPILWATLQKQQEELKEEKKEGDNG